MDTGTHITMGIALGGIATLDTVVRNDPTLFNAVIAGTIIGSNAPDFDTILKLRNNAVYIRHHRGITHSIPAVLFWGIFIATVIHAFVPEVSFLYIWQWTFLAVILHVFVDIFNVYGTQAFRPFTRRWIAYGVINAFDPYIFSLHVVGIIAWLFGAYPGYTWLIIYSIIVLYYLKRYAFKRRIIKRIHQQYANVETIVTSPTLNNNVWRLVISTSTDDYVGVFLDGKVNVIDKFEKIPLPNNKLIETAKSDKNVSAFLSFSPVYRWEISIYDDFTEVRFIDLRYRKNDHYPFVAIVQIDDNYRIMSSYTGWVFSEEKLQSKLLLDDPSLS